MMIRLCTILTGAAALAGCVTSAEGLSNRAVADVVRSAKSPEAFASCVGERMCGMPQVRHEGDRWSVIRANGVGAPIVRWDFFPEAGGGSRAELKASQTVLRTAARDKVRSCA